MARLRKSLGAHAIETVPHGYRLAIPADEIDALRFERLLARGQELLTLGEPDRAAYVVDEALGLWRGRAFVDLDGWEAGDIEARRLEELPRAAEELRLEARLRAGRFREVLAEAQARVAAAPLRELRWALLALAEYQAGRQGEALRTPRRARTALSEQLGLDPGPVLVELEQAILRQDPSLVAQAALPEASATCPYLGLVPYDVGDADAFFGRDADVAAAVQRLAAVGVLAVVGPSGSGKSSLVRAGVVAALRRDGHRVVVITPGAHPMDALTALPEADAAAVLVVDQCEEAVTLCRDAGERARFFAALARHGEDRPLVIAMRADRLGDVSAHPEFARLVERGLQLLKSMDEADLRSAIEGPARQAGLLVEPGLVDLLVRDVEGNPGALPMLSHALRQTWERREGRALTVSGYRASGGIRGAVAQSAEQVYEQAPPERRPILRDLLLRLVTPSPEGEPVRSRVPRRLVAADAEHEQMVELLVGARLVTSDEDVVELAHEALARAWPRLRGWLDDDVEGQRILRHLSVAADTWQAMGRPDSELCRGVRLARALEWRARATPDLNPVERSFLETSQQRTAVEREALRRRRRALVSALAAGLVVMTMLASVALVNQRRAGRAAEVARARELVASAIAALDTDPALAKLLALAATEASPPTIDTMSVLHRVFAADRVIARYTWPAERSAESLVTHLHPDGNRLVAASFAGGPREAEDGTHLEVYDFDSDEVVWTWNTDDPAVFLSPPFFTADGERVVHGLSWLADPDRGDAPPQQLLGAQIRDADTGELLRRLDTGRCGGVVAGASETHLLVQTVDAPDCLSAPGWVSPTDPLQALELVDLDSGERAMLSAAVWWRAAMSGDGRFAAFTEGTGEGAASVVVDVASGERVLEFDPFAHEGVEPPGDVRALNRDGSLVIAGDRPMAVLDVAAGEVIATFDGHAGDSSAALFAPDGASVHSVGPDGHLRHWDARSGAEVAAYPAAGGSWTVSVAADGQALVTDAATGRAALLDTGAPSEVWGIPTCGGFVVAQTLEAAGGHAAVSDWCPGEGVNIVTYVIDVAEGALAHTVPGHHGQDLAVSPDGTRFVRQDAGERPAGLPPPREDQAEDWVGPLRVRDLATGKVLTELQGICTYDNWKGDLRDLPGCALIPETPFPMWTARTVWAPDSSRVAVAVGEGLPGPTSAVEWDAGTGELLGSTDACRWFAWGLSYSPDGDELLISCGQEDRLVAVSTQTWEQVRSRALDPTQEGVGNMEFAGYTSDGRWLLGIGGAFGAGSGSLHWIDPQTLDIEFTLSRIHDGSPKSWALSADRALLATGASDGFVKVWDVTERRLVHEISIGQTQAQGVAFVGDHHLAVAPQDGGVYVYTLDPDELLGVVRASLTRGFTAAECARFDFDDDCPTLAELRHDPSADR